MCKKDDHDFRIYAVCLVGILCIFGIVILAVQAYLITFNTRATICAKMDGNIDFNGNTIHNLDMCISGPAWYVYSLGVNK